MNARNLHRVFVATLGAMIGAAGVFAQTQPPTRGPAENGSPSWFLQGSFTDPGGNTTVDETGRVTVIARVPGLAQTPLVPPCSRSPLCGNRLTPGRQSLQRVQWEQTLGYA